MADRTDSEIAPEIAASIKVASPSDAVTSSTTEISAPMFDVHAPHESIHTWKSFSIHIATIVIGLLIAVGLEQTVELFHHRHQLHKLQEGLQTEAEANVGRNAINIRHIDLDMSWLLELRTRIDALRTGQAKSFEYPSPPDGYPSDPMHRYWRWDARYPATRVPLDRPDATRKESGERIRKVLKKEK